MTKTLLFIYPNPNNRSETFIYNQKKHLKPNFSLSDGWFPHIDQNQNSIFRLPLSKFTRPFLKRCLPNHYQKIYTYFLIQYLKKFRPDAALVHYGVTALGVLEALQRTQTRLIVHFHGFDASDRHTLATYGKGYPELFGYAKKIVVVSEDMKRALVALGADERKIVNNPYGVETEHFLGAKPSKSAKIAIAVGRFTGKKAPQKTIEAFSKTLDRHPEAILKMIGTGELWEDCKTLVKELNIENSVYFLGNKTPDEIAAYLKTARLFVQHSVVSPKNGDSEGTPNTILEASAAGLPVVSTFHAGIKEAVVDGQTGFLVQEGDIEGMSDKILKFFDDAQLAQRLGENGRKHIILNYEINRQMDRLRAIIFD